MLQRINSCHDVAAEEDDDDEDPQEDSYVEDDHLTPVVEEEDYEEEVYDDRRRGGAEGVEGRAEGGRRGGGKQVRFSSGLPPTRQSRFGRQDEDEIPRSVSPDQQVHPA